MPDVVTHVVFGRDVRKCLQEDIRARLIDDPYEFALLGPDVWFAYQPWKHREGRGRRMHTTAPGAFLMALADRCCVSAAPAALFSYLAGFLCHYALDAETHPYIIHMTEVKYHYDRCHMCFERALDAAELQRASRWGQSHPVTRCYYKSRSLPSAIRSDIDTVYEDIYGWKHCWKLLNRSSRLFRLFYRIMENPKGVFSRFARLTSSGSRKSLTYSESPFIGTDVENLRGDVWQFGHDASMQSAASFPELRDRALQAAVRMISAAYRYVFLSDMSREELRETIGNRSYLSGFPADDPRNLNLPSMLPPSQPAMGKSAEGGNHP